MEYLPETFIVQSPFSWWIRICTAVGPGPSDGTQSNLPTHFTRGNPDNLAGERVERGDGPVLRWWSSVKAQKGPPFLYR